MTHHDETTPSKSNTVSGGCTNTSCCPPPSPFRRSEIKVGRNDPCPCGNGLKYKKCCGKNN